MKIVVLEPLGIPAERVREILRGAAGAETEVVCYPDRVTEPEALGARCAGAEIAVLANLPFPRAAIERCDSLKLLCVAFTGVDHVDVDCCRERGVAVCNCAGYATTAVAELTFGLLFSLLRRLPVVEKRCRDGGVRDGLIGRELEGKTFGVVGSGAIGSRVCALAGAFGCRVLACNRSGRPVSGAESVTLEELLRESDIVSLHTPLTPETRGMIGREQLAMMKPGALLLNTARGDVVDSAALREVYTEEYRRQMAEVIAKEMAAYIEDKAKQLGLAGTVTVEVEAGEAPQLKAVHLAMPYHEELSGWLTDIGLTTQYWQEGSCGGEGTAAGESECARQDAG